MRILWDRYPDLPYRAVAPWPVVERNGMRDWVDSVESVESWLIEYVGPHWTRWTWDMMTLHNPYLCGVSFARESDSTLFLLRWS